MRRLLLVFMIALLPLRALVGDAMAMTMVAAPAHGASHAEVEMGSAPCADHTAATVDAHDNAGHQAPSNDAGGMQAHSHDSCDLCNGPAMSQLLAGSRAATGAHGIKPSPVEPFVSFEPQRGIKPPIS